MSIQFKRGTTLQHATYVGAVGELTFDTDKKVAVLHDGITPGGWPQAAPDGSPTQPFNAASMNGGQLSGFRNKIINGDMQVSQVNGAAAVTPSVSNSYPIDQWQLAATTVSKLTVQQVADAPAGFKFSTKVTVAAQYAPLATDTFTFQQPIEGQNLIDLQLGTAGAATIATGQYIKGSVAGNYAVAVRNGTGTRSYIGVVAVTTAWAKLNIVLVGDTAGAWATDNTAGLIYSFDLGSGSNFNAPATNVWQAGNYLRTSGSVTFVNQVAGSTLNITGVQLEQVSAGATSGTSFEHVSYADQLRWCQRYLPCWNSINTVSPLGGVSAGATSPTTGWLEPQFPVSTRVGVNGFVISALSHLSVTGVTGGIVSALSLSYTSTTGCLLNYTAATQTSGQCAWAYFNNAAGRLYFTGAQM